MLTRTHNCTYIHKHTHTHTHTLSVVPYSQGYSCSCCTGSSARKAKGGNSGADSHVNVEHKRGVKDNKSSTSTTQAKTAYDAKSEGAKHVDSKAGSSQVAKDSSAVSKNRDSMPHQQSEASSTCCQPQCEGTHYGVSVHVLIMRQIHKQTSHIHIYIYIYIYIYTYTHTYIYTHTHTYTYIHVYVCLTCC
jgi:hypothetical protein